MSQEDTTRGGGWSPPAPRGLLLRWETLAVQGVMEARWRGSWGGPGRAKSEPTLLIRNQSSEAASTVLMTLRVCRRQWPAPAALAAGGRGTLSAHLLTDPRSGGRRQDQERRPSQALALGAPEPWVRGTLTSGFKLAWPGRGWPPPARDQEARGPPEPSLRAQR